MTGINPWQFLGNSCWRNRMTDSWKSDLLVFLKSVADDACCLTGVNEAKPKKA
jgi:hypothetical protein